MTFSAGQKISKPKPKPRKKSTTTRRSTPKKREKISPTLLGELYHISKSRHLHSSQRNTLRKLYELLTK